jgi:hypothetical protein
VRSCALHHAVRAQRQHGGSRVVGEHVRVPGGPARCELGAVEKRGDDDRRSGGADDVDDVVDLGEVLADERDEGDLVAQLDEVQTAA